MLPSHSPLCYARPALFICCSLGIHAALAQSLPPPGRTIFKCEQAGKIAYSDEPCLGASKLDIVVPRGMDHLSGKGRAGADVRHEIERENFANALKPLSGMTPAQFAIATRRQGLGNAAQHACSGLDSAIPLAEQRERDAAVQDRGPASAELYRLRKAYRATGC